VVGENECEGDVKLKFLLWWMKGNVDVVGFDFILLYG
jgi:hypothetical protein